MKTIKTIKAGEAQRNTATTNMQQPISAQHAAARSALLRQRLAAQPEILGHYLGYKDLSPTHGQWIKIIWAPQLKGDTLLLAHRNSYKSTTILIVGVIYYLLYHPNETILLARKEYKGAAATLQRLRKHYQSKELVLLYQLLGLGREFKLQSATEQRLVLATKNRITQEGNIEISGISGKGITGRHYNRIHLDDVVTEHDRDSAKERLRTLRFYENLKNVIVPGGSITATGTPWQRGDLYSQFKHVHKYPVGSVAVSGFTRTEIARKKKELPPELYASQYQLTHVTSKQHLFAKVHRGLAWREGLRALGHIDAAFGGENTSALTMLQLSTEGICVIGKLFKGHIREHYPTITQYLAHYNITGTYIETNADKGALLYDLQMQGINAWGYHETMSKHIKIVTILYRYWRQIKFHTASDKAYIEQIRMYNEHALLDDAPDSLASLLVKCGGHLIRLQEERRGEVPAPQRSVASGSSKRGSWVDFMRGRL